MIQLNDEQYWLYAAVDPETNELLHTKLEPTITRVLAHSFLTELSEKHDVGCILNDEAGSPVGVSNVDLDRVKAHHHAAHPDLFTEDGLRLMNDRTFVVGWAVGHADASLVRNKEHEQHAD